MPRLNILHHVIRILIAGLLSAADDAYVGFNPFAVGHTIASARGAFSGRRAPEPNVIELIETVGRTASIGEQFITLTSRRHRRHGTEPSGKIALKLGVQRPFKPFVSAVGVGM